MRTAEVARAAGCSVQQVRDLEHAGVIPPARRAPNGYRAFGDVHVAAVLAYRSLALAVGPVEARGVMADWARTALGGRYAASGIDIDLDAAMARFTGEARAIAMAEDWLAPPSSVKFLLSKFRPMRMQLELFDAARLGTHGDHFAWMKQPAAVADWLLRER